MIITIIILFIMGCSSSNEKQEELEKKENMIIDSVLVIFKDAPDQKRIDRSDGAYTISPRPIISYTGKPETDSVKKIIYTYTKFFTPKPQGYDSLRIHTTTLITFLNHLYKAQEIITIPLVAGDTVLITYDKSNFPVVSSLRDPEQSDLYQLLPSIPGYRLPNQYTSYYYSSDPVWFIPPQENQSREEIFLLYKSFADSLRNRIVSFKDRDQIHQDIYTYYLLRLESEKLLLEWRNEQKTYVSNQEAFKSRLHRADSLLNIDSYLHQLQGWLIAAILTPVSTKGEESYLTATTEIFKAALNHSFSNSNLKKSVLFSALIRLDQFNTPLDSLLKYSQHYAEATGDSLYLKKIIDRQQELDRAFKDDLQLISLPGDTTLFQNVIKQHAGKVIYVDYWASWCAPCRREMPAAKKLREEYKGKEVVFIYLALNDTTDKWREAVKKEQTDYLGVNYFINNSRSAKMIKELKIESIPRFMIYDRKGKLVEPNAPRPGTPEARKRLNHYLAN